MLTVDVERKENIVPKKKTKENMTEQNIKLHCACVDLYYCVIMRPLAMAE